MNILNFFITGFIIGGIGTCIGGILSILIYKPSDRAISGLLSYAAGIMLAIISFDLMPKAYEIGGFFIVTLGLAIGLIIIFIAERMIPSNKFKKYRGKNLSYIKMSMIIIISLSLHNFPEGVAIGSSSFYSSELGIKIGILIAAHNIPEGMSVGIPLKMAGSNPLSIIILTLLTGLPTAFGAVLGAILGGISDYFIAFCLSAAASSMLYVSANKLIPEANILHQGKSSAIFLLIGFICGCYLSFAI
ncbi:ZIP family metal transporter [Sedimentibacter sp. MB31-C6]|uniref:ZIP family metal transporter n=1 Tax=Sedimentibacter sp. MB31-C6 TaxID=3109366 RepID=UPI002DDCC35B|nr:ZIP family metal transporter [Sedimentibacter sp. MB36-C1]WSI05368.1 ZIP family metal transporter [Sedimentibacter sp. MB36-C1]